MKIRFWHFMIAIPLLLAGLALWASMKPRGVEFAKVVRGPALDVVYATGFVEVENPAEISARMTAPVTQVLVREGEAVRKGQVLALLDAGEQESSLAQLRAQRRNAEAQARRTRQLFAQGWATAAARDSAVASAQAAVAAEAAAAARLAQYRVVATAAGVVLRRDVEPGDMALPNKNLFIIGDPSALKVTATIDERDVVRLRVGQAALLSSDAYPGKIVHATLREITPSGDPTQRAFRARLALAQGQHLPVGLTFEVNIVTRRVENSLLVPSSAVVDGKIWQVVDGRARSVPVKVGIIGIDKSEILSGVAAGDVVVSAPPKDLKAGQRLKNQPPKPAQP